MDLKDECENICVLCCREISIYAVGSCDHHVCFECSSRMRVLCKQNECPICRTDLPLVIFTYKRVTFSPAFQLQHVDKEFMIGFEDQAIHDAFKHLLEDRCPKCDNVFPSFKELERHVRREHSLNYCSTCADNLKLFTFERKCYDRRDLAHHNRKGDIDDTSHRGHPPCEFCHQRFMDNDDRYRHLRKEHFFCHFCDADGRNIFFDDYKDLRDHFQSEHYLCEEDDCAKERFIGAFRSMIDFKAHKALKHTRNKTKAEVKQARTLDFEFTYAPRHMQNGESSPNQSDSRRGRNHSHRRRHADDNSMRYQEEEVSNIQAPAKAFNAQCAEDFPLLSTDVDGTSAFATDHKPNSNCYSSRVSSAVNYQRPAPKRNAVSKQEMPTEDFPALASRPMQNSNAPPSLSTAQILRTQSRPLFNQKTPGQVEPQGSKNKKNNSPNWGQKKKAFSMADFPELKGKNNAEVRANIAPSKQEVSVKNLKQSDESLAQQIYRKCKTESKMESETAVNTTFVAKGRKPCDTSEDISLSLLYGGGGMYNPIENQENKNPDSEKYEEAKILSKAYRSRSSHDEEVPWSQSAKLAIDVDFPPLASNPVKCPPGFGNIKSKSRISTPPPGFNEPPLPRGVATSSHSISLSSIAQQLTNSKVKSSFIPKTQLKSSNYQEPIDFQERNNILIHKIHELIGSNNKLFDEFKLLSGNFRKNKISATEYHANCLKILNKDKFLQLFSELLCLLPDIEKQQELLSVHETFLKEDSKTHGAVPKKHQSNLQTFSICPTCLQVLAKRDFSNHQTLHKNEVNYWNS